MNERNVWDDVRLQSAQLRGVDLLSDADAVRLAARFAERFVDQHASRWWWDTVRTGVEARYVPYDDGDPWELMGELLVPRNEYVMLVTDEEPDPRGGVRGSYDALRELVAECPYFEYVLTDDDVSFGLFDTHHNVLIGLRDEAIGTRA